MKSAATQKVKEVGANAAENKAVALGVDLKTKYDIDLAKDTPQQQVLKIIKVEAKNGNGELASLLADASKVTTIGEAMAVIAAHKAVLEKKIASGELTQEAKETTSNTLKGLASLALFNGAAAAFAYLKGKNWKEALAYLSEKVEISKAKNETVAELRDRAKNPLPGEEKAAAVLATYVKTRFPKHA